MTSPCHPAHELLAGRRTVEPSLTISLYGRGIQCSRKDADCELLRAASASGVRGIVGRNRQTQLLWARAYEVLAVGRQFSSQLINLFFCLSRLPFDSSTSNWKLSPSGLPAQPMSSHLAPFPDGRVDLLEGDVVQEKMDRLPFHGECLSRLGRWKPPRPAARATPRVRRNRW